MWLAEFDRKVVCALLEGDAEEVGRTLGAHMEPQKTLKTRMLDESGIPIASADAAAIL